MLKNGIYFVSNVEEHHKAKAENVKIDSGEEITKVAAIMLTKEEKNYGWSEVLKYIQE